MAGPGRATSGRPTLQTSSNQRDSNHLARTPVTNVVNLRPKTLILSEKALGLTTFVTTDQKSTRKTPPIDDVCNNTQRSAPKSQHDKPNRIGGPENPAAVPVGGGGARPGFEPTRQATQQHPSPTGVEGAGGAGGHGRAAKRGAWPRCRWAVAGPGRASRSTTPSRRLACGDLAGGPPPTGTHSGPAPQVWRAPEGLVGLAAVPVGGGGARAGLEIDHSEPQARVWRSRGRAAAHGHTTQPGPSTHTKTPTRNRVGVSEPPVGIEPTTYSLRVNRSAD